MDNSRQQIVEKLQNANNILVTVSANPTVDQLAACIGLTILLNKMNKHATAVFSGKVPSTIEFLKPEETLESNTDSLRDFIISLDKAKADKLRYKVEDEVVKIFITPYKASINEKDLVFSQGDFNVDVVMALGVHEAQDLDNAITAHGRILHDAVVICVNTASNGGELGSINLVDPNASGMSELVTSLAGNLDQNLLDEQISTALLTGIVAQTERFSNQKTTPSTMTASATLLAAGANQQLVSKELAITSASKPASVAATAAPAAAAKKPENGELDVPHEAAEKPAKKAAKQPAAEKPAPAPQPKAAQTPAAEPAPAPEEPTTDPDVKLTQRVKRIEPLPHEAPTPPAAPAAPAPKPVLDEQSDDSLDAILRQEGVETAQPVSPELPAPNPSPNAPVIEVPPAPETVDTVTAAASEPELPAPADEKPKLVPMPAPASQTQQDAPKLPPVAPPAPAAAQPAPAAPPANETPAAAGTEKDETLTELEESVKSPHIEEEPEADVDSARKAVEAALKTAPEQNIEPLAAVGAVNVDLNLGHDDQNQPIAPETQPGPGVPPAPAAAGIPGYLQTPPMAPVPNGNAAAANMPPFEDLPSTPPPMGLNVAPPPQVISPNPAQFPPQGPPPPLAPPPMQ